MYFWEVQTIFFQDTLYVDFSGLYERSRREQSEPVAYRPPAIRGALSRVLRGSWHLNALAPWEASSRAL